jgi:CheY-like chemotaxis protein
VLTQFQGGVQVEAAKILVVDDDPIILGAVTTILNGRHHAVVPASGPREALQIVRHGELVDVVVSDFYMPELNGGELIREIARISPSTMGIVITAGMIKAAHVPPCVPVLKKPFGAAALLATVEMMVMRSAQLRARLHEEFERATKLRGQSRQLCKALGALREQWLNNMKARGVHDRGEAKRAASATRETR